LGVESSEHIQQILGFINSKLEVLNLQGNSLENKGCFNVMRSLEINRSLKKLNLADNKFNDEDFLVDQIYCILEGKLFCKFLSYMYVYKKTLFYSVSYITNHKININIKTLKFKK
jgi:hypothetical protein